MLATQATQFRIWATQTLREFITKGFVLDDERLKLNKRFDEDYFDELLERIFPRLVKNWPSISKSGNRNETSI